MKNDFFHFGATGRHLRHINRCIILIFIRRTQKIKFHVPVPIHKRDTEVRTFFGSLIWMV